MKTTFLLVAYLLCFSSLGWTQAKVSGGSDITFEKKQTTQSGAVQDGYSSNTGAEGQSSNSKVSMKGTDLGPCDRKGNTKVINDNSDIIFCDGSRMYSMKGARLDSCSKLGDTKYSAAYNTMTVCLTSGLHSMTPIVAAAIPAAADSGVCTEPAGTVCKEFTCEDLSGSANSSKCVGGTDQKCSINDSGKAECISSGQTCNAKSGFTLTDLGRGYCGAGGIRTEKVWYGAAVEAQKECAGWANASWNCAGAEPERMKCAANERPKRNGAPSSFCNGTVNRVMESCVSDTTCVVQAPNLCWGRNGSAQDDNCQLSESSCPTANATKTVKCETDSSGVSHGSLSAQSSTLRCVAKNSTGSNCVRIFEAPVVTGACGNPNPKFKAPSAATACTAGTFVNFKIDYAKNSVDDGGYTWECQGSGGGATAYCERNCSGTGGIYDPSNLQNNYLVCTAKMSNDGTKCVISEQRNKNASGACENKN